MEGWRKALEGIAQTLGAEDELRFDNPEDACGGRGHLQRSGPYRPR